MLVILLIIYALGLISVGMIVHGSRNQSERKRFKSMFWNPFICFFLGLLSPIIIPFMIFDWIFNVRATGYYNGTFFYDDEGY